METEWLAIQSFQHSQNLLSAINTLSIHTKLELAGILDEGRVAAAERARETIVSFLAELQEMAQEAEKGKTILGVDPRRRQLVESFIAAKHNPRRFRSALFQDTSTRVQKLLRSNSEEDSEFLLECLKELRILLEDHIHTDAVQILGEI